MSDDHPAIPTVEHRGVPSPRRGHMWLKNDASVRAEFGYGRWGERYEGELIDLLDPPELVRVVEGTVVRMAVGE